VVPDLALPLSTLQALQQELHESASLYCDSLYV
jgi:hypothetical protein